MTFKRRILCTFILSGALLGAAGVHAQADYPKQPIRMVVGFAAGEIPKVPFNLYLLKSANVMGVFWGAWTERDPEGHRANNAQLLAWAAEGKLSSHVHAVYPLADAPVALKALAARQVMGKVILRP